MVESASSVEGIAPVGNSIGQGEGTAAAAVGASSSFACTASAAAGHSQAAGMAVVVPESAAGCSSYCWSFGQLLERLC